MAIFIIFVEIMEVLYYFKLMDPSFLLSQLNGARISNIKNYNITFCTPPKKPMHANL